MSSNRTSNRSWSTKDSAASVFLSLIWNLSATFLVTVLPSQLRVFLVVTGTLLGCGVLTSLGCSPLDSIGGSLGILLLGYSLASAINSFWRRAAESPVAGVWPTVSRGLIGFGFGVAIIMLTLAQLQPREVTRTTLVVREETHFLEREVNGKKIIVPLQVKPAEPVMKQEHVALAPTLMDQVRTWVVFGIDLGALIFLVVCVSVLALASHRGQDPPGWATHWANNIVFAFLGVFFGFVAAERLPESGRITPAPAPPAATAAP